MEMLPDKEIELLLQFLNQWWWEDGEHLIGFRLRPQGETHIHERGG